MTKQAIVTLAIGADYAERFEHHCRANWSAYAKRHGFDLIVITEPLDTSDRARRRSPAWQKCLAGIFCFAAEDQTSSQKPWILSMSRRSFFVGRPPAASFLAISQSLSFS